MAMPSYPIYCLTKDCKNTAEYKIAARWSDGIVSELKTYGLCCGDCLPEWFRLCQEKRHRCRLTAGEVLDSPGIYRLRHGQRDRQLERLEDLEKQIQSESDAITGAHRPPAPA